MNYISSVARYLYHKIPFVSSESKKSQPDPSKTVQTAAPYKKKHVPKTIRNQVWRKYCGNSLDSICYCCHQKLQYECWEAGHIIAEVNGGATTLENLRPICVACNRSMGRMNMIDFMKRYGLKKL
jgi:5-methylcytosine-specific restriction endonuclease McrA